MFDVTGVKSEIYFAYGSNLDQSRLNKRLGDVSFLGRAKLAGYRLAFTGKSKTWGCSSTATVVSDDITDTCGICYALSEDQLEVLDEIEGHRYFRDKILVTLGGKEVGAWIYIAPFMGETKKISRSYIDIILDSYLEYGFSLAPLISYLGEHLVATRSRKKETLRECIAIAGKASGLNVLGKTRDRNYIPPIKIVREIVDDVEIVYMFDERTNYLEGMNEKGIGVINSALMVKADEKIVDMNSPYSKKKNMSPQ